MSSQTLYAIQFLLMLSLGLYMLMAYRKLVRAAKVAPEDPKVVKMMKVRWIYVVGMDCAFVAASMFLAEWMMGMR